MAPSKLAIRTSAVQRLIKEELSYHKELSSQEARLSKLEISSSDENAEYQLKQEKQAVSETKTVLASMKGKIRDALQALQEQLEESTEIEGEAPTEEVTKAEEVAAQALQAIGDTS